MNYIHISGNIGKEAEYQVYEKSGKQRAKLSVAINIYKAGGEKETMWLTCEMWDTLVDRLRKCEQVATLKGRQILVSGALAINSSKIQIGGETVKSMRPYIKVANFELLGKPARDAEETTEELEDLQETA